MSSNDDDFNACFDRLISVPWDLEGGLVFRMIDFRASARRPLRCSVGHGAEFPAALVKLTRGVDRKHGKRARTR